MTDESFTSRIDTPLGAHVTVFVTTNAAILPVLEQGAGVGAERELNENLRIACGGPKHAY